MDEFSKKQVLIASSGWLAALLNLIPGLGTGYIYQRRWKGYWITNGVAFVWLLFWSYQLNGIDPSDPIQNPNDSIFFLGILVISIVSAIEAWTSVNNARN